MRVRCLSWEILNECGYISCAPSEMVASLQHTHLAETQFFSKPQVRLSSPRIIKLCCRKFTGLGTDPPAPFIPKAPPVSRAEFLTQKRDSQSKPPSSRSLKSDRISYQRQDLHSLKETLQQRLPDENPQSYRASNRQDLQVLKGYFNQQAETQPKTDVGLAQQGLKGYFNQQAEPQPKTDVGSAQQRVPRADTLILDSKTRPRQANPAHKQLDTQSKQSSSATSLGSPDVEKGPSSTFSISKGSNAHLARRRGSRNSSRGFDVLDELMSSQGRSSRAVLENLQSAVVNENDDMPYFHPTERDALKAYPENQASPSYSGKVSTSEVAARKHGIRSQMLSDFRRIDTWQLSNEATDTVPTSSTFASSIGKALSPSTVAKASSTTSSTLASSINASVLQQISNSPSEIHSGKVSEVAKPSLRGQEVMWALQKAAVEKAKQKQKARKVSEKASKSKETASLHDSGEWRNAKPIIVKAEWALQIDELERRIENLINPMSST